jgi:hypothetical protein
MKMHLCCGPQQYSGWLSVDAIDFGFNVVADLEKTWNFAPAESAEYMVCKDGFEHVGSPSHFLAEAARILAPGGVLQLWVPHYRNPSAYPLTHRTYYSWSLFETFPGPARHGAEPEGCPQPHLYRQEGQCPVRSTAFSRQRFTQVVGARVLCVERRAEVEKDPSLMSAGGIRGCSPIVRCNCSRSAAVRKTGMIQRYRTHLRKPRTGAMSQIMCWRRSAAFTACVRNS